MMQRIRKIFGRVKATFAVLVRLGDLQRDIDVATDSVQNLANMFDEAQERYVTQSQLVHHTAGSREIEALYRELVDVLGKHGIELDVRQLRHSLRRLP